MSRCGADAENGVLLQGAERFWERSGTLKGTFDTGCESSCRNVCVSRRGYDEGTVAGKGMIKISLIRDSGVEDRIRKAFFRIC